MKFWSFKALIYERFNSQGDFAETVQIREDRLSRIIHGREQPRPDELKKFASTFGKRKVAQIFKI